MATQNVTLNPGESKPVAFTTVPALAKTYTVAVDGLTGSFTATMAFARLWGNTVDASNPFLGIQSIIQLSQGGTVKYEKQTTLTGGYIIENIVPGSYVGLVTALVPGFAPYSFNITFSDGEDVRLMIEIPRAAAGASYRLAAYYIYIPGKPDSPTSWPEWESHVRAAVEYEAKLITDYVQAHGINGSMSLVSILPVAVDSSFFTTSGALNKAMLISALKLLPSWGNSDVQVCVGSTDAGTNASAVDPTTTFMYLSTIEQDVKGMEGTMANRAYCELAHEFGHIFDCHNHCANKPCPMAMQYLTYAEWVSMGKMLWFCDIHRPLFLNKWQQGL